MFYFEDNLKSFLGFFQQIHIEMKSVENNISQRGWEQVDEQFMESAIIFTKWFYDQFKGSRTFLRHCL